VEGWVSRALLHLEVQPAWALIGCIALVAVCFANAVPNDFILDDYGIVAVNPAIRTIAPLHALATPYWGEHSNAGVYRPLTIFSFSLEYPLWHRWAGGYRLTNLLLHAFNGFLLFLLARRLLQSTSGGLVTAAIYLAHPVHTEPVVGLVGRSELLAAMFFLLAWLFFREKRTILCMTAFFLSLLSKENAIAFPAVALLDCWISEGRSFKGVFLQWKRFAAVLGTAAAYLALRIRVLHGMGVPESAQYFDGRWTLFQRELTSGRAFLEYFRLLIAPVHVTGDYDFNSIPIANAADWVAWIGLAVVLATLIVALRGLKTDPRLGFGILFFYVTILPVSNWIVSTSLIMAERFLYLPSIGVCLIAGLAWTRLPTFQSKELVAGGLLAAAAVLCIAHNYVWRDERTFFGNMVQVLPDNVRGRQGYGVALVEAGRPEEAISQFQAGLRIVRNSPLLVGLAEAEMQIDGGCSRARPALDEALRIQPHDSFARWLSASCFEREGALERAESSYRQAVADTAFPDPKLLSDWGRVLEKTGRFEEAGQAYARAASVR
jgi:tetratricopeptide (TPR) repeat protein